MSKTKSEGRNLSSVPKKKESEKRKYWLKHNLSYCWWRWGLKESRWMKILSNRLTNQDIRCEELIVIHTYIYIYIYIYICSHLRLSIICQYLLVFLWVFFSVKIYIELRYYSTFTLFFCFAVSTILLTVDFFQISLLMLSESKRIN